MCVPSSASCGGPAPYVIERYFNGQGGAVVGQDVPVNNARETALDLIEFLDASPSPYQAPAQARQQLTVAGFIEVGLTDVWPSDPGRYVVVDGGSLFAWVVPDGAAADASFRVLGGHTHRPPLQV